MRQSNLELLRLSAMFLVLVVHAAFFSLGWPKADIIRISPLEETMIALAESFSIICVNVFILISGWFGIKPKIKSLSNFLFQVFFFLFGIYFVMVLTGFSSFSIKGVLECFTITPLNWFIKVYLTLFFISPVLNAFVNHADKRTFKYVLITFFTFQTVYGWTGLSPHYQGGYSTISFIGLYLLARYLKIYKPSFSTKPQFIYICVYMILAFLLTVLTILPAYLPITDKIVDFMIPKLYQYICPLVIAESLAFFFIFEKMNISSKYGKIINKIAISNFAVFLLHTNPNVVDAIYRKNIKYLYTYTDSTFVNVILIGGLILFFFFFAILLDQVRILLWNRLSGSVENVLHSLAYRILDKW